MQPRSGGDRIAGADHREADFAVACWIDAVESDEAVGAQGSGGDLLVGEGDGVGFSGDGVVVFIDEEDFDPAVGVVLVGVGIAGLGLGVLEGLGLDDSLTSQATIYL